MSSTNTVAKTTPIAMYAVARHMLNHELPAPLSIDGPGICEDDSHDPRLPKRRVIVTVTTLELTAWLDSIVVDDEHSRLIHIDGRPRHEVVTFEGRIGMELGDVAVAVKCLQLVPRVAHACDDLWNGQCSICTEVVSA